MKEHSQKVEELFDRALQFEPDERAAFLAGACGADLNLRKRMEDLLIESETRRGFLSSESSDAQPTLKVESFDHRPDETVGQSLGRYKLLEKVGEGGCGVVYVAEQTEPVRRRVALKVIKLGMDTKAVVARFEAERQALAIMDHPSIAKVLDAGATEQGRPYFVMELVRGIKITDYCDQEKVSTRERLDLFIKVCQAIQHAHQKGIIHRDIKPSNILVTLHDGVPVPKVIDFGIAKATEGRLTDSTVYTQLHQFIGTPAYMSPEQAEMSGLDIDTRSDIYSLGVLLYELLAGSTPFDAKELMASGIDAMRKTIREQEPPRPSMRFATLKGEQLTTTAKRRSADKSKLMYQLKGDLDWIVMKCLEKDRARRYETANGVAADIKHHLNNEPVTARPPSRLYEFQKTVRRHKFGFAATAAIILVLAVGVIMSNRQAARAKRAEQDQTHLREAAEAARAGEAVQRQQAEAAQAKEEQLRKLAQVQTYAADMKAAQAALQQNSRQQAVSLLDQYWPKPGEPDWRDVEWRYLWQAAKGDEIYTWNHPGMVAGALFSPDGQQVATACFDGVLRIWNVASGKLVTQFDRGVSDESVKISFGYAPDGTTLASASREGIVLLDCATWRVKRTLELPETDGTPSPVDSLIYSPDGQWLAVSSGLRLIRFWNTANWESFTLPVGATGRNSFSPDSKTLAVYRGVGTIELWNIATKARQAELRLPSAFPKGGSESWLLTRFSTQGDRLTAATGLGYLAEWDLSSGEAIWASQAHRSRIYGLAVSHDGKRFASGGFDQLIHVWDAATQKQIMTLQGHLNEIWSLEFSPDDRYLLTSSKDGTVKLWDSQTKPPADHWMLDAGEWPVGYTPDGRGVIAITGNGATVRHWRDGQVIKSLSSAKPFLAASTVFSPETQRLFALQSDREVQVYDANSLQLERSFKLPNPSSVLYHVSPDQRWLAGRGSTMRDLQVWDTRSGNLLIRFDTFQGDSASRDLAVFSPDSRLLAFGSDQWEVKIWDVAKQQFGPTLPPHPWRVYSISFSADGRFLASSSWEGDIRIIEVATGKQIVSPLYGHGSGVHGHSFPPDGATLISGGDDSSVRFWNITTGREMLVIENAYNQLARIPFLSPTGELLVWRDFKQDLRVRVTPIATLAEIEKAHRAESTAQ